MPGPRVNETDISVNSALGLAVEREMPMPNPKLDVSQVVACFPGQTKSERGFPGFNLFTPFEVALRENQLRLVQSELDLGPRCPAHYLLYAQGEPDTREQSRIGGLPYRPRCLPWPMDVQGHPKEFVCQIDFSDSRRLLPELPGEIMLLFASEDGMGDEPFTLEWYPPGLTGLMSVGDLPRFHFTFPMVQHESVFCYLYETFDFPEAETRIRGTPFEAWESFGVPCGSKIAGVCESAVPESQHIFTLESIRLLFGQPFPFANRKDWEPDSVFGRLCSKIGRRLRELRGARNPCYDILMIGDLGRIHVFKQASGRFYATSESY